MSEIILDPSSISDSVAAGVGAAAGGSARKNYILVVDDIELNREILKIKFEEEFDILEAENGLIAYQQTIEHKDEIVAILLDLMMPVMTGSEFLSKLREDGLLKGVPIFIITAQENEEIQLGSFEYGITDVITKPFNSDFLEKRVRSQIELYQTRRSLEYTNMLQAQELIKKQQEFASLNMRLIQTLALAIEFRSGETGTHVQNINKITNHLLHALRDIRYEGCGEMTDEQIDQISFATILHDVGKISIPDAILNKPGRFTPDEYEIMKTHTTKGAELIEQIGFNKDNIILTYAYDICRHHHERYDGRGYPDGLEGDEISLAAQIVSIADVYDALTQERCYKKPFPQEKALEMIVAGECGCFNPKLLKSFVDVVKYIHL